MYIHDELERILAVLIKRKETIDHELKCMPDGQLVIVKRGEKKFFNERIKKGGNRKKDHWQGITKDKDRIAALVRKEYLTKAARAVRLDIDVVREALDKYQPTDENSLMYDFAAKNPELADFIYYGAQNLDDWARNYTRKEDLYEDNRTSIAPDGTRMRSRGELYIYTKLIENNIPFRYEAPIGIPELS